MANSDHRPVNRRGEWKWGGRLCLGRKESARLLRCRLRRSSPAVAGAPGRRRYRPNPLPNVPGTAGQGNGVHGSPGVSEAESARPAVRQKGRRRHRRASAGLRVLDLRFSSGEAAKVVEQLSQERVLGFTGETSTRETTVDFGRRPMQGSSSCPRPPRREDHPTGVREALGLQGTPLDSPPVPAIIDHSEEEALGGRHFSVRPSSA